MTNSQHAASADDVEGVGSSVVTNADEPADTSSIEASLTSKEAMTVSRSSERDETHVHFSSRSWRVRGARARANLEGDRLSVALSVSDLASGRFHLDTLDLYTARARAVFLDVASVELACERIELTRELSQVLPVAEETRDTPLEVPNVEMTSEERAETLRWLSDPDLATRLRRDLGALGVVGEETNLLVCYLATVSRKCERPFGVLVQSSSAGGKSTVVDAVTALVPDEDLVTLSAMTSQALYYLGGSGLRHKVLSIAEEYGSSRASYALKLLVSEGRLSIASTGKDASTGRLATKRYETAGPLSLLMTTTATTIDPELENRLVVLGVNEDPAQTEAIIASQRRAASLEGLTAPLERDRLRALHQNIQRLIQPLPVVIPEVTMSFPTAATRHRRDHAKLLSMIAAVTLLHQHQRECRHVMVGTTRSPTSRRLKEISPLPWRSLERSSRAPASPSLPKRAACSPVSALTPKRWRKRMTAHPMTSTSRDGNCASSSGGQIPRYAPPPIAWWRSSTLSSVVAGAVVVAPTAWSPTWTPSSPATS